MIDKEIKKIFNYLEECQWKIDDARETIENLQENIKVNKETEDFLYDLYNNDKLPQDIKEKAEELWKKI